MEAIWRPQHTLRSAPGACKIRAMKSLLAVLLSVAALAAVAPPGATLRASVDPAQAKPTPQTPPAPQTPPPTQTPEPVQGPTFRTGVDLVADRRRGGRSQRPSGRGSPRARFRREDRRRGSPRRLRRTGQGRCRSGAEAGRRQERDVLHQQPDAAQRPADHPRRRSDQHQAGIAAADHGRRAAVPRSAEPARSGRVHHLSGARPARQLHQRQAASEAGDAGAHRPAAAHDRRSVQHRRVRSAWRSRRSAIS